MPTDHLYKVGQQNEMVTSFLVCHTPSNQTTSGQVLKYLKAFKNSQTVGERRLSIVHKQKKTISGRPIE
jgi:hypothetical protein